MEKRVGEDVFPKIARVHETIRFRVQEKTTNRVQQITRVLVQEKCSVQHTNTCEDQI